MTRGGSSTVHIYTQTVHRTTQLIWEECGPCPVFLDRFSLKSPVPNFKEIRPLGDKRTGVHADVTTLIDVLRDYAKVRKEVIKNSQLPCVHITKITN